MQVLREDWAWVIRTRWFVAFCWLWFAPSALLWPHFVGLEFRKLLVQNVLPTRLEPILGRLGNYFRLWMIDYIKFLDWNENLKNYLNDMCRILFCKKGFMNIFVKCWVIQNSVSLFNLCWGVSVVIYSSSYFAHILSLLPFAFFLLFCAYIFRYCHWFFCRVF